MPTTSRDYCRILVPVVKDGKRTIRLAGFFAQKFGATLIGIAGHDIVPRSLSVTHTSALDYELARLAQDRARRHIAEMEALFRREALMCPRLEWQQEFIDPSILVAEQSCLADLIVMSRPDPAAENFDARPDIGDVLLRVGRPILVAPDDVEHVSARNIVVAWKNTREARRAVMDALPLLVRAETVIIAAIGDEACFAPEACLHLEAHGVNCRTEIQPLTCDSVAEQLENVARHEHADLIVSGAYGRSRAREWAFGGVTRDLLRNCPLCCFLSH